MAELKGVALSIPNQHILIDTRSLQEARESSAIENMRIDSSSFDVLKHTKQGAECSAKALAFLISPNWPLVLLDEVLSTRQLNQAREVVSFR